MNKLTQRVMARVLAGTVIVTSVVGGSAVSEETARLLGKQLTGKAHEVATFVKNSLGLSVPALAFLMEIDPTVVHRKSYLVDSGRMRFIDELDRAGLIDAEEISSGTGSLLRVHRSRRGEELYVALMNRSGFQKAR